MSSEEKNNMELFLTDIDEADENAEYIKPDIEVQLSADDRQQCRDIVLEIKDFIRTKLHKQRKILYIIYLLSLELENVETMKNIVNVCKIGRKNLKDENKLILPK